MTNANGRRSQRHPDEQELIRVAAASAALRRLLAAAAAPPSAAELRGRSRAIAAFRAARQPGAHSQLVDQAADHVGSGRRGAAKLARAGRRSAARLTVACTALIVLLGGTAAAAAGELPTALRDAVSDLLTNPSPAPDRPAPGDSSAPRVVPSPERGAVASSSPPDGSPAAGGHPGSAAASPPQLAGLCRAYQAAGPSSTTLDRPGFAPLVSAAGGAGGVTAFCAGHGSAKAVLPPSARPRAAPPKAARSHPAGTSAGTSTAAPAGAASPGQPAVASPAQPRQAHARARSQAGRQPAQHVGR